MSSTRRAVSNSNQLFRFCVASVIAYLVACLTALSVQNYRIAKLLDQRLVILRRVFNFELLPQCINILNHE